MKRIIFVLIVNCSLLIFNYANGQVKDTAHYWKRGGMAAFNINQVSLTNWAAGGESSLSVTALANGFANYKKGTSTWDNSIDLGYGILKSGDNPMRKNEDKIDINSKYGQLASGKFYYSALINFKSQFDNGYNYPDVNNPKDKFFVSKFLAPAYLILSLGMDYKPNSFFSLYLSPATGRFIFVNDRVLADAGAYGVDKAEFDNSGIKIKDGKTMKTEFGAYLTTKFQKDIIKNVNLMTKLSMFNNYTDKVESNRKNIDVNWEVLIGMKVNKYITTTIYTNLLYDHNIDIPKYKTVDGKKVVESVGPKTQFKEVLGVGLSYKF